MLCRDSLKLCLCDHMTSSLHCHVKYKIQSCIVEGNLSLIQIGNFGASVGKEYNRLETRATILCYYRQALLLQVWKLHIFSRLRKWGRVASTRKGPHLLMYATLSLLPVQKHVIKRNEMWWNGQSLAQNTKKSDNVRVNTVRIRSHIDYWQSLAFLLQSFFHHNVMASCQESEEK